MTVSLSLPPEMEGQIKTIAERYHITAEAYLLSLIESALPKRVEPTPLAGESDEEFTAAMTMLHRPGEKPLYPDETWSRATIYQDHD